MTQKARRIPTNSQAELAAERAATFLAKLAELGVAQPCAIEVGPIRMEFNTTAAEAVRESESAEVVHWQGKPLS